MKGWKKIFCENGNKSKAVCNNNSQKDFKSKTVTRDKEHIMMKSTTHKEDLTIINIYLTNIAALKYMTQTLTKLKG